MDILTQIQQGVQTSRENGVPEHAIAMAVGQFIQMYSAQQKQQSSDAFKTRELDLREKEMGLKYGQSDVNAGNFDTGTGVGTGMAGTGMGNISADQALGNYGQEENFQGLTQPYFEAEKPIEKSDYVNSMLQQLNDEDKQIFLDGLKQDVRDSEKRKYFSGETFSPTVFMDDKGNMDMPNFYSSPGKVNEPKSILKQQNKTILAPSELSGIKYKK